MSSRRKVSTATLLIGARYGIVEAAIGVSLGNPIAALLSLQQVGRTLGTTWLRLAVELGKSLVITATTLTLPAVAVLSNGIDIGIVWPATPLAGINRMTWWVASLFTTGYPLKYEVPLGLSKLRARRGFLPK